MSIFISKKTKLIVQGITGRDGSFHAEQMKKYGTKVVGGVTPGKGGAKVAGIPVFDTVEEAVVKTKANTSVIYVPPPFAVDAIFEAVSAGIKTVICITEGVPANDMMKVYPFVKENGARLIGPNCPGLISVGQSKVGIMPSTIVKKGGVGVVSRSGTLTYEAIWALTVAGMGQSTCIGIGGDQVIGTNFIDCLEAFQADPATKAIVIDRRNRRFRRRRCGQIYQEVRDQAGGGVHRRSDRSSRQAYGSRRSHHRRRQRHSQRQDRCAQ
jgi:succinyl-CoA synthetase alpha subunit